MVPQRNSGDRAEAHAKIWLMECLVGNAVGFKLGYDAQKRWLVWDTDGYD